MRKTYQKPMTEVVKMNVQPQLMSGSPSGTPSRRNNFNQPSGWNQNWG